MIRSELMRTSIFDLVSPSSTWIIIRLAIPDVGWFLRTIGLTVHPTIELKRNGNNYTLVTQSTFRNTEINFQLGKEFDEETLDGRQVKSVITLENDNKLIQKQGGEKPSEIIREFDANKMVATMTVDDVVCTRTYEVQA